MSIIFVKEKRNKHSARVVAAAFEKHFPSRDYSFQFPVTVDNWLPSGRCLILFSFNTVLSEAYFTLARKIRHANPQAVLVCGGPHPSAMPEECAEYFDTVCVGEGELAIKDIVEAYDDGQNLGIIKGRQVGDLGEFHSFPRKQMQFGPIEITRGCPGRCHYCQTPSLFPGKLRHRPVELIVEDIKLCLKNKPRPMDVRFITSDATMYRYDRGVNLAAIEEMLSAVRGAVGGSGRIFYGSFPSEFDPSRVMPELVDVMKRYCDNRNSVIGLQSASKKMLKLMNRKSTVEDAENAAEILLSAGYEVVVDFIFGLPYEDEETIEDSIKWIEKWRDKVVIHAHPFFPMPGSVWAGEKPTPVPEKLLRVLRSLEGRGGIFGKYIPESNLC